MSKEPIQLDDSVKSARSIADIRTEAPELFTDDIDTRSAEEKAYDAATDPREAARQAAAKGGDGGDAKDAKDDKGGEGAAVGEGADKGDGGDAGAGDDAAAAGAGAGDDKGDKGDKGKGEQKMPKARFDEVNEDKKRIAAERDRLAQQIREREERDAQAERERQEAAKTPPRDFDKEFDAIEEEYENGTLSEREYRTKTRKLEQERVNARQDELLKPVLENEAARVEREALDAVNSAIDKEAVKMIAAYPMLDHKNKATANVEAINAVVAERNANIELGMDPAKALRLAVAEIADKMQLKRVEAAPPGETPQQKVERERRIAAAAAAAGASAIPADPKQAGGQGARATGKDPDPIESMTTAEWAKLSKEKQNEYLGITNPAGAS